MPIIVAITVVTFETIDVAVLVTTLCTPPMSFEIRDCTSPVRVRVKNASESRWRCRKTAVRRSCMTRCPTWFESSVCQTPSAPVKIGDRDHAARVDREGSSCRAAGSPAAPTLRRNAGTTPIAAEIRIRPSTIESRKR